MEESYSFSEMQSVYSLTPADWAGNTTWTALKKKQTEQQQILGHKIAKKNNCMEISIDQQAILDMDTKWKP